MKTIRRTRVKGGRKWKASGLHPDVAREFERELKALRCSASFLLGHCITERYERRLGKRFGEEPLPATNVRHMRRAS